MVRVMHKRRNNATEKYLSISLREPVFEFLEKEVVVRKIKMKTLISEIIESYMSNEKSKERNNVLKRY
jgi:hypothetical protein